MPSDSTRRRVLRALGASGAFALAGCLGDGSPSSTESPPTETSARTPTDTTETTYASTGGPDERVDAEPPGSPALDPSGSWPGARFDAGNTAYNPDGTGLRDGERYWRLRPSGTGAFADGALFNVAGYEPDATGLTRRTPGTAAVEASTPLVNYGVQSPPAVADGRAFVTTFIEVFCVDAADGGVLWRGPEMDGVQGAPAVADGAVFVNSGGFDGVPAQLRAFEAASGEERWRYDTESETKSTPAVADGVVYVVATDGLHAVDTESGERVFHEPEAGERWTTPVVADGLVYVVVAGDDDHTLLAMDAATGDVQWRESAVTDAPPVVADGTVYVETDGSVVALDANDGSTTHALSGPGVPLARVDDVVYADDDATLRAYDAGGEALWSYRTPEIQISDTVGRAIYGVTPVDGAVYVSARDALHGLGPTA